MSDLKAVISSLKLNGYFSHATAVAEAADEIARLRSELAELRKPDLRTVLGFEAGREDARAEVGRLREVLHDAQRQIEYLHGKFQETGSGNAVLARITGVLSCDPDYDLVQPLPVEQMYSARLRITEVREYLPTAFADDAEPDPRDARIAELEARFRHIHVRRGDDDTCASCGLDIRDALHVRQRRDA